MTDQYKLLAVEGCSLVGKQKGLYRTIADETLLPLLHLQ